MTNSGTVDTAELLFALLRLEICDNAESVMTEPLTQDNLSALYRLGKEHDIMHILSSALQKSGLLEAHSDEITEKILKSRMVSVYRCERQKYALKEISRVLEKEKIPYVLLKGAVIRQHYPQEWMRTSCDIDILVHEEDLSRAIEYLVRDLSYKTDSKQRYHDVSLYSPGGVHLELHFNIKESMENIDRMLSRAWEFSERDCDDGVRYRQTNEFFLFHHIAHMSYHFIHGGCGIKPFMDLYVIKSKMEYDDKVVRDYCAQCGIEKFYDNVLSLTDVWFRKAAHTSRTRKMEEYILKGGVYGTIENKVVIAQGKRGGKGKYILSRIFVPYDSLKNLYPILKKHKFLFPLMQIRRWFGIIFSGRIKRGVVELKANQNISQDRALAMNKFLKDIGL